MAGKTINPTRMELTRLKAKQKTALRGHKLLKDKRDGLMKQFMQEVRRTRQLRKRVEDKSMAIISFLITLSPLLLFVNSLYHYLYKK